MSESADEFDAAKGHWFFSSACFNGVWQLLDKKDRTEKETGLMIEMAHASLFHWLKREDCTDENLSVGYWQVSRVYATAGIPEPARVYAECCLGVSGDLEPFFRGYAHEALARAAKIAGNSEEADAQLEKANTELAKVTDQDSYKLLKGDLDELVAGAET